MTDLTRPTDRRRMWIYLALGLAVMIAAAGIERAMGHSFFSKSGVVRLWVNETNGPETSQQIADWYSVTHVLHGIIFYFVLWLAARKWPLGARALAALFAESAWEVFENCPFTIERYRAATMAIGYYGDSILNSMTDILSCMAGFALARFLPAWATVLLVIVVEVGLAIAIHDDLTLNIIMLIHPVDAIKHWQAR